MQIVIDILDKDIPKTQDILSVDLCFIDGHISQCTYPFEVLEQEPKTGHCKGCKWRKNRDEVFKRGVSMESLCASCYVRNKE